VFFTNTSGTFNVNLLLDGYSVQASAAPGDTPALRTLTPRKVS